MAEVARVLDFDVIKTFRTSLIKFIESCSAATTDAEAEIIKKMNWLEGEQAAFWTTELRKANELVGKCKDAVRQKKIFKDSTGKPGSAIDEEKALKKAQAKLLYIEERLANTKKNARQLQREHMMYRGGVQRFQTILANDLPNGVDMLENVLVKLDAYLNHGTVMVESTATTTSDAGSMGGGDGNMKRAAEHDGETVGKTTGETAAAAATPPAADAGEAQSESVAEPEKES